METAIEKAVNWWADKLYHCKHSGLSPEERKRPENDGYQLAEMLMTFGKPKVSAEQVEKFKASLRAQLEEQKANYFFLDVDYHPNRILSKALEDAGIDSGMGTLPIKTRMWIEGDKVEVCYGYGAEPERL